MWQEYDAMQPLLRSQFVKSLTTRTIVFKPIQFSIEQMNNFAILAPCSSDELTPLSNESDTKWFDQYHFPHTYQEKVLWKLL
jgi:hypothetical protein